MFRGVFEHQIDSKGRTSFPAKLRDTLVGTYDGESDGGAGSRKRGGSRNEPSLIITSSLDSCLHAYPVREWEALETALARRNPMEPGVKTVMRLYVAPAQECPLDKLGRLLIPPQLRAHAHLDKDVIWAGMVKVIELWSKPGWEQAQADARTEAQSPDVMRVLSELRQN